MNTGNGRFWLSAASCIAQTANLAQGLSYQRQDDYPRARGQRSHASPQGELMRYQEGGDWSEGLFESNQHPMVDMMFVDLFAPLIHKQAKVWPADRSFLGGVAIQWLWNDQQQEKIRRALRATVSLLQRGFDRAPGTVAQRTWDTFDAIRPIQAAVGELAREVHQDAASQSPDRRFEPLLRLYNTLYERFYATIATPMVVAAAVLSNTAEDMAKRVRDDGRVQHSALINLEEKGGYSRGIFTDGLERHLRNCIAHQHYKILSKSKLYVRDVDPKAGRVTWGPYEWTRSELYGRVGVFKRTCETLLTALAVFNINNRRIIQERKFASTPPGQQRVDILIGLLRAESTTMGFRLDGVASDGPAMTVRLRVLADEGNRTREIFSGGDGWVQGHSQSVSTRHYPLSTQVYGFLHHNRELWGAYEMVRIEVSDVSGQSVGAIAAGRELLRRLPEYSNVEPMKKLAQEDTLTKATVPVTSVGIIRAATPRLRVPKKTEG